MTLGFYVAWAGFSGLIAATGVGLGLAFGRLRRRAPLTPAQVMAAHQARLDAWYRKKMRTADARVRRDARAKARVRRRWAADRPRRLRRAIREGRSWLFVRTVDEMRERSRADLMARFDEWVDDDNLRDELDMDEVLRRIYPDASHAELDAIVAEARLRPQDLPVAPKEEP